ncbi:hypothetical protein F0L74_20890 [Chitinophaga agrisoli]|uniref:Uncharacterized protein n=1 Tax=Chitinophaga agrisoli TaxID=2607653 RepID=A0A5B2VJ33_9BACT|nr:hypothetical protein [Chitinophaga agrisoli]KAA2238678.1 hypothetical protein F0L74_20890 [Chitinophaga agrisoli]
MYKRIFASTYKYYARFKTENPRSRAAGVVTVSQFGLLFLVLALLKRAMIWDIATYMPGKYVVVPIVVVWFALVFRYYSNDRIAILLNEFNDLPAWKRKFWAVMSVVLFLLPLLLTGLALVKRS